MAEGCELNRSCPPTCTSSEEAGRDGASTYTAVVQRASTVLVYFGPQDSHRVRDQSTVHLTSCAVASTHCECMTAADLHAAVTVYSYRMAVVSRHVVHYVSQYITTRVSVCDCVRQRLRLRPPCHAGLASACTVLVPSTVSRVTCVDCYSYWSPWSGPAAGGLRRVRRPVRGESDQDDRADDVIESIGLGSDTCKHNFQPCFQPRGGMTPVT